MQTKLIVGELDEKNYNINLPRKLRGQFLKRQKDFERELRAENSSRENLLNFCLESYTLIKRFKELKH